MADHELIDESERDKFAGTSAVRDDRDEDRDGDGDRTGATRTTSTARTTTGARRPATSDDDRPMHEPTSDYERGRADEAREQRGQPLRPRAARASASAPTTRRAQARR